jgi:hypothetical protein
MERKRMKTMKEDEYRNYVFYEDFFDFRRIERTGEKRI